MKIASVADIKAHFSAYLRAAVRGPVVVTRNGKSVGVLLAVGDEEELERLVLAYSPRLRTILEAARQRIRAGAGVPHQEFWQELEGGNEGKRQSGPRRKTA
ncbi:MAG: type II toxin-antitoxin system Phd/YefM family antitoxin [Acidobacteria bacterium]|jgi:prevent-host-death family protein|nr:type II toxin-antitoxin system Phd/YefM family antitoxin [Acidobacteriota bacterium]